jgi:predicted N-acetyltransferase YhbS
MRIGRACRFGHGDSSDTVGVRVSSFALPTDNRAGDVPSLRENLGNGLILRSVRDERDAERFIALNASVTGEGSICDRLLHHHPRTNHDDYLIVENERTGEVVSTTCLIPWQCRYQNVVLDVAMLEMVVTRPDYRRRGLVRAQVGHFHRIVAERGFDLCIIQGIPYYYRQYGYTYALDHTPRDSLPSWRVPDESSGMGRSTCMRAATPDDAEALTALCQQAMASYDLCVLRTPEHWHYLLRWAQYPVQVVTDAHTGAVLGYVCVRRQADSQSVWIPESGVLDCEVGLAVLRHLKAETSGEIVIGGSAAHTLVRLARRLGSTPLSSGQWLLRIPGIATFLAKIGPVLEWRLKNSDYAGLAADLCLNLYRQAFKLRFRKGNLEAVELAGFVDASMGADGGDLCIPPDAFVRLVFGYRGLDELLDAWPDIVVRPARRGVLDVLFPRMGSWVWAPY